MSNFTNDLKVLLSGNKVITLEQIEFYIEINGVRKNFFVPQFYKSDLASIPRILWTVIPPFGKYNKAGLCHDFMYEGVVSRSEADLGFKQLLIANDVNIILANLMFLGVRLFGKSRYKRK